MTKLIDTHAHLHFKSYEEDRDEIAALNSRELSKIINVGTSIGASENAIALSKKFENFYTSIGVHPHHVEEWKENSFSLLNKLGKDKKVVAIGEIGLDKYAYKKSPKPDLAKQSEILESQISLAMELGKPILFHCREAYNELFDQILRYKGRIRGLMHCFMGDWEQAKKFLDLGLYISFAGNLTYKGNDFMREVAKKLPEDKILIETDSPFLTPEPFRGQRNQPIYVTIIASTLAKVRGCDEKEVARFTTRNAEKLFKFTYE